jgi:group I intron endonuclease
MKKRVVYLITNIINSKVYIGQTNNLRKRTNCHRAAATKKQSHPLYNAMNYYGIDNFVFSIIEECAQDDDVYVNARETFWIMHYRSIERKFGYNIASGGKGFSGFSLSEESKLKISLALKGRKRSEAHREKIRLSNVGRKASPETKEKMSKAQRDERDGLSLLRWVLQHENFVI